jgi:hypothetical protein
LLVDFADTLEAAKSEIAVIRGLHDLDVVFDGREEMTVAAFVKEAKRKTPQQHAAGGLPLGSLVPPLEKLSSLLSGRSKKVLIKDLDSLLSLLRSNERASVRSFVAAVTEEVASASRSNRRGSAASMPTGLVSDYLKRLETALGDDKDFKTVFEELRNDQRITQHEAVTIASNFSGRTPPSTSRQKALARIWERHQKLMDFKKRPSTAGRPAA